MEKVKRWKYKKIELIGGGSFSQVYKCRDKNNDRDVAIKWVVLTEIDGVDCFTVREVSVLKEMDHVNIVKLLDIKRHGTNLYLVFEHLDTDLNKLMTNNPQSFQDPALIKKYLQQILRGVEYCHSHNVLHRDIKPSNLLINTDKEIVKLADFGLSRSIQVPAGVYSTCLLQAFHGYTVSLPCTSKSKNIGVRWGRSVIGHLNSYSAFPSTLLRLIYGQRAIFGEMVKQNRIFPATDEENQMGPAFIDQLTAIFRILGTPTEKTWPRITALCGYIGNFPRYKPKNLVEEFPGLERDGVDLLYKMLQLDPRQRITARDALLHPYFVGV